MDSWIPPFRPRSISKDALVGAIAEKAGVSKKTAGLVLSATLDVLVAACLTEAEGWRGEVRSRAGGFCISFFRLVG